MQLNGFQNLCRGCANTCARRPKESALALSPYWRPCARTVEVVRNTWPYALRTIFLAFIAFSCASCAYFAPKARELEPELLPDAFSLYENTAPAPDRWWTVFDSGELNDLMDRALAGNLSLQQIYARLEQAEQIARQAGAARWPDLNVSSDVSAARRRVDTGDPDYWNLDVVERKVNALGTAVNGTGAAGGTLDNTLRDIRTRLEAAETVFSGPPSTSSTFTTRSYRFGLASGFEVDLWGRLRALHLASRLDYQASQEEAYGAMLSLSGTVVRQWLDIVAYRQELALLDKQLELNRTTQDLMIYRYRNGLATALDVFQQRQIVAQTETLRPPLEAGLQTAQHELAVLLGKTPRAELPVETAVLPALGSLPAPGLPADILARRPDVRAAGLALNTADWRIAAARADRLPALRLTASASYGADEWALVFDNWMATMAASLSGPIFDAGRRKAEVNRARAVAEERLAAYQARVLQSIKEVENAMLQESKQADYIAALQRQLDAVRASHRQAEDRYRKGLIDYLPVLSALTEIQVLERRLLVAEHTRLAQRTQLCVALGGAWMEEEYAGRRGDAAGGAHAWQRFLRRASGQAGTDNTPDAAEERHEQERP